MVKKYNIDFSKIKDFINQLKVYIQVEKSIWDRGLKPAIGETKNHFINKYWNYDTDINGIKKVDRNNFEHKLDKSLIDLI